VIDVVRRTVSPLRQNCCRLHRFYEIGGDAGDIKPADGILKVAIAMFALPGRDGLAFGGQFKLGRGRMKIGL
jgi:hypothetical protein